LAAISMLASASTCAADPFLAAQFRVEETHGYTHPYQRCSWKQICGWFCYRPLPWPRSAVKCNPSCTPPLYLYFIGEYGPRSPLLVGYVGPYHGQEVHGPMVYGPVSPEHGAPVPAVVAH
jgi:hypothetical protein